jgi:hypothetical protein
MGQENMTEHLPLSPALVEATLSAQQAAFRPFLNRIVLISLATTMGLIGRGAESQTNADGTLFDLTC